MNETGLILYVYLPNEDEAGEESCLTVCQSISGLLSITNVFHL